MAAINPEKNKIEMAKGVNVSTGKKVARPPVKNAMTPVPIAMIRTTKPM